MNYVKSHWDSILPVLLKTESVQILINDVLPNQSYQPKKEYIFEVFKMPIKNIKVVILGIEPSTLPQNSFGYSFIENKNYISLLYDNIVKEIRNSDSEHINNSGEIDFRSWVDQGVFLLNTALTVETGNSGSHIKYWEEFTRRLISIISSLQPCLWVLWGKYAQNYIPYINSCPFLVSKYNRETIKNIPSNTDWNYILTAPYPISQEDSGFFGCNHFYFINEILRRLNKKQIIW